MVIKNSFPAQISSYPRSNRSTSPSTLWQRIRANLSNIIPKRLTDNALTSMRTPSSVHANKLNNLTRHQFFDYRGIQPTNALESQQNLITKNIDKLIAYITSREPQKISFHTRKEFIEVTQINLRRALNNDLKFIVHEEINASYLTSVAKSCSVWLRTLELLTTKEEAHEFFQTLLEEISTTFEDLDPEITNYFINYLNNSLSPRTGGQIESYGSLELIRLVNAFDFLTSFELYDNITTHVNDEDNIEPLTTSPLLDNSSNAPSETLWHKSNLYGKSLDNSLNSLLGVALSGLYSVKQFSSEIRSGWSDRRESAYAHGLPFAIFNRPFIAKQKPPNEIIAFIAHTSLIQKAHKKLDNCVYYGIISEKHALALKCKIFSEDDFEDYIKNTFENESIPLSYDHIKNYLTVRAQEHHITLTEKFKIPIHFK